MRIPGLTDGALVTDPDVLAGYARDRDPWSPAGTPSALVRAADSGDVVAVMKWAAAQRVPVVPRGAGSGLAGAANAVDGCVVLSLERMRAIKEVDDADLVAVVQPGVVNADLKRAAAAKGLFYAPDPGSYEFCTIGGNVATNAGGLCCVKYGVTRDAVLGLEVVLADGRVLRTGGRTVKDVAGLDLTRLFVGSEGMLGVVTEVTVRLLPARPAPGTLVATFDDLVCAGEAVSRVVASGRPSMCELMDDVTIDAVESFRPMGLDASARALLVIQSDAGPGAAELECQQFTAACEKAGATFVMATQDQAEGELLTAARRMAVSALEAQGGWVLDDVVVPLSRMADLVAACGAVGERHGVQVATFGHAGDGNMHPTIVFDQHDPAARDRARAAFDAIVDAALQLGGTITGEHGVGLMKRRHLVRQVGEVHLDVQRAVKAALDPLNILNPGKSLG
ncbi:MAG TPA: FAD-linked oxidase C-terminal domain-containing protein [Actinomycetales bacterium]|nr:FAD-linked oxidase C-terminal domain-containing protein [Actinomycetales bacterium]